VAGAEASGGELLLLAISRRRSFPVEFFFDGGALDISAKSSDELRRPAAPLEQITRLLLFLRATARAANFTSER